jgi:hypothetical protein
MEFERSIYRVHDRILRGPNTSSCLTKLTWFFFALTVFSIFNLYVLHTYYVDDNEVLKAAMEEQLKPYFYKEYAKLMNHTVDPKATFEDSPILPLNYSTATGKFMFDTTKQNSTLVKKQVNGSHEIIVVQPPPSSHD